MDGEMDNDGAGGHQAPLKLALAHSTSPLPTTPSHPLAFCCGVTPTPPWLPCCLQISV